MPNNITGVGVIGTRLPGELHISNAFNFTMTEERQVDVSQGHSATDCTSMQDFEVADKSSSFTVTISTQILTRQSINWILFNNKRQTSASIILPNINGYPVVGGTITVPGVTLDQTADVVILQDTAPGAIALTQQASGTGVTATTSEVGAGSITVDAVHNGKTAVVYYRETQANKLVTGGNTTYAPYQDVELFAKFCGTKFAPFRVWIPKATSLNGINLDPKADNFSREFRALIPTELGFTVPYVEWEE